MRKSLTNEEAKNIVLSICQVENYDFLGFCTKDGISIDYNGVDKTFIKLHCNICDSTWYTVSFANFKRGTRCPKCGRLKTHQSKLLNTEVVKSKIQAQCKKLNYQFLGFCNKENTFQGINTYLILKCNNCGNSWETTTYDNFIRGKKCPVCALKAKSNKRRTPYQIYMPKILNICEEKNYQFLGFCDKNGNNINTFQRRINTYLNLKCNNCGNTWKSTCYCSFIRNHGCPKCQTNTLENEIRNVLTENNINFEEQKTFDWLKHKKKLHLDFYLPQHNIAIECQGIQHFEPKDFFGGLAKYHDQVERDEIKKKLCEENNIKLLYYSNLDIIYPYKVYGNTKDLLTIINK